jgi:RNA polymerase sigma-70 factor (ECF subfamily)
MDSKAERQLSEEVECGGVPTASPLDFRTLFQLEVGYVVRSLRRLGVRPADLEDLAHEVFIAVHGQLNRYDPSRPLRPWLFGFAFRIASHYRRKRSREVALPEPGELPDRSDGPEDHADKEQKRALVLAALAQMEFDRRAVFVMHELDGQTCNHIAAALEIPVGTVYSRLRLARRDFAAILRRLRDGPVTG